MTFDALQHSFHRIEKTPSVGRLVEGVMDEIGLRSLRGLRGSRGFETAGKRRLENPVEGHVGNRVIVVVESADVAVASREHDLFHSVPSSLFPLKK